MPILHNTKHLFNAQLPLSREPGRRFQSTEALSREPGRRFQSTEAPSREPGRRFQSTEAFLVSLDADFNRLKPFLVSLDADFNRLKTPRWPSGKVVRLESSRRGLDSRFHHGSFPGTTSYQWLKGAHGRWQSTELLPVRSYKILSLLK